MLPIKQSFVLETKTGRYFQDIINVYANNDKPIEKVMQTTNNIIEAERYYNREEAIKEAMKYDFKVLVLSTYIEEL